MGDDELAELRRRRMAQLQQQAGDQQGMQEELERQERQKSQIQMILMQVLEPDARERLNNIKLTKPDLPVRLSSSWLRLHKAGGSRRRLPTHSLKELLRQLAPKKRDYSITRR